MNINREPLWTPEQRKLCKQRGNSLFAFAVHTPRPGGGDFKQTGFIADELATQLVIFIAGVYQGLPPATAYETAFNEKPPDPADGTRSVPATSDL